MSLTKRITLHSMYIKTGSVATWVDGLKSQGPDMGVEVLDESGGSETDTEFVGIRSVKPTVPFVTSDLSLLSAIGMQGLFIQPASGKPGVELYGREQPQGGLPTAEATANHLKGEISDGLIVPLSIRGSNQQAAELSMLIHAILGTTPTYSNTEPIKWTSSSAIRTGAGGVANIYLPSVVKINSRYIEGNLDIQVDFGLNVFKEAVDSEVEDSEVTITARKSKIMFTTRDLDLASEVGKGLSLSSGFGVYFRKQTENGVRVAKATTSHVAITGEAGLIIPGAPSMQHQQPSSMPFTIIPSKGSALLGISTSAAIPAS